MKFYKTKNNTVDSFYSKIESKHLKFLKLLHNTGQSVPPPVGVIQVPSVVDEREGILDSISDRPPQPAVRIHALQLTSPCR